MEELRNCLEWRHEPAQHLFVTVTESNRLETLDIIKCELADLKVHYNTNPQAEPLDIPYGVRKLVWPNFNLNPVGSSPVQSVKFYCVHVNKLCSF